MGLRSRSGSGAVTDPGQYRSLLAGTVVDLLDDKHGLRWLPPSASGWHDPVPAPLEHHGHEQTQQ